MLAIDFKNINWQRFAQTSIKVLMDLKILGLVFLNISLLYAIGWDTIIRPSLDNLQRMDKSINEQSKVLTEKEKAQQQYSALAKQLKDLDNQLIPIYPGNSATVISVTEAAEILSLLKGKLRDNKLPYLQPPHNLRENVSLTPVGDIKFDILTLYPPASPVTPLPSGTPSAAAPVTPTPVSTPPAAAPVLTLPVDQFTYDLKVSGTYSALVDVINELSIRKNLVKISKVTISKPTEVQVQPDAKDYPDFPVKLDMLVTVSIFLYEAAPPLASP